MVQATKCFKCGKLVSPTLSKCPHCRAYQHPIQCMFCQEHGRESEMREIPVRRGNDGQMNSTPRYSGMREREDLHPVKNHESNYWGHKDCISSRCIDTFSCPACTTKLQAEPPYLTPEQLTSWDRPYFKSSDHRRLTGSHIEDVITCNACGHEINLGRCYFCGFMLPTNVAKKIYFLKEDRFMSIGDKHVVRPNTPHEYEWHESCSKEDPAFKRITAEYNIAQSKQAYEHQRKESPCFIATAVYESPTDPHVVFLKEFRDIVLSNSPFGRAIVKLYYSFSPSIAHFISGSVYVKRLIRYVVMNPLIAMLRFIGK